MDNICFVITHISLYLHMYKTNRCEKGLKDRKEEKREGMSK